nr:transcription initiation factor iie subunit beta [Quercus suber]
MSLQKSLQTFKTDLQGAAARNINRPISTPPNRTSTPKPSAGTEKRTHDAAFAPPSVPRGGGRELMTVVLNAVARLKEKSPQIITFDDLIAYLSLPVANRAKSEPLIKQALRANERVEYIADGDRAKESFKYRPIHPVTNADELRTYLATLQSASGLLVKDLKDGWPDCTDAINELEKQGHVLVIRHKKDNLPRTVYADSPALHVELPATSAASSSKRGDDTVVGRPDELFVDFWNKNKPPANESELRLDLERAGLTPSSVVKEPKKLNLKKKERKRVNRSNGKFTNRHMKGILKDFGERGAM